MRCQVNLFHKAVTLALDEADEDFWQQVQKDMEALQEELGQCGSSPAEDQIITAWQLDDEMEWDELAKDQNAEDNVWVKVESTDDDMVLLAKPKEVVVPASVAGTMIDLTSLAEPDLAVCSGNNHRSLDITTDTNRVPAILLAASHTDTLETLTPRKGLSSCYVSLCSGLFWTRMTSL